MMVNTYSELDEYAMDALRELGNIGTGNAMTSLANMTAQKISIEVPAVRIVPYQEAPALLGGVETVQTGILLEVSGDISGIFMFLLNEDFTRTMLKGLLGYEVEDVENLDEISESAVSEMGNIMCCSYINALSSMLDLHITITVPSVCCDMAGALLSVPMIRFANMGEELMFIENSFQFDSISFISHILFLPELASLNILLEKLGLPYE